MEAAVPGLGDQGVVITEHAPGVLWARERLVAARHRDGARLLGGRAEEAPTDHPLAEGHERGAVPDAEHVEHRGQQIDVARRHRLGRAEMPRLGVGQKTVRVRDERGHVDLLIVKILPVMDRVVLAERLAVIAREDDHPRVVAA
jgi:hypothetical protein